MNVLVSGANGLLGATLVPRLRTEGHRVLALVRREPRGPDEVRWDTTHGMDLASSLPPVDAFVHLAGESIAGGLWTAARKLRIRESRAVGTRVLATSAAALSPRPSIFASASAIGWYGSRGDELLDESSAPGTGFLAEVGRAWEAALAPAQAAGIRTLSLRFGLLLSTRGGLLAKMLPAFRMGLGGALGSGRQWMSWVSADDAAAACVHALHRTDLAGPVNVTAPMPVRNADLTRILARVLGRPAFLRVPAGLLRAISREMADDVFLASQRVVARRLTETGFVFRDVDVEATLRRLLGGR